MSAAGRRLAMSIAVARVNPAKPHDVGHASMNRQRSAGQNVGLPGGNELAAGQHFQLAEAGLVATRRHAAHRRDVADEHDPLGSLGTNHRLDDGGRQMMAIDDQAGGQPIVGQLIPDVIRMAADLWMSAVAQVRAHPRAGIDGGFDSGRSSLSYGQSRPKRRCAQRGG